MHRRNCCKSVFFVAFCVLTVFSLSDCKQRKPESRSASGSPFQFGGACSTVGSWTQAALTQTDNIINVVNQLKDNPNCKGIESVIPQLKAAGDAMAVSKESGYRASRLENLPAEISALQGYAAATPNMRDSVLNLLASRNFEAASLGVEAAKEATILLPPLDMAKGIYDFSQRAQRVSQVGLAAINGVLKTIPQYEQCLIGRPDQGMALLSAAVKMAASFASAEEGIASQLSDTIANLVTVMRDRKFTAVLRQLNETQFWVSMSCLMETTSYSYCSARDAANILREGIINVKEDRPAAEEKASPLEGYYIITRHVPNVSQWVQKVQFGVTPRLSVDAQYQNLVFAIPSALLAARNTLRGSIYNDTMNNYATLTDDQVKRSTLLDLVEKITANIERYNFGANVPNFFTQKIQSDLILFKLIGLNEIPQECTPAAGANKQDPHTWMLNGGRYQPQFNQPDVLARTIGAALDELIDEAYVQGSRFFRQRINVDTANLVNESMASPTYSVTESLTRIQEYLGALAKRAANSDRGVFLVPSIVDTQQRITAVLDSYGKIRDLAKSMANGNSDPANTRAIDEAYANVVDTVYDKFNVLLLRDAFVATRVNTYVYYDFSERIRSSGTSVTNYEKEILTVAQDSLMVRISQILGDNPDLVKKDLESAQVVNKRNLEAIESLLGDSLVPVLSELDLIVKGQRPSNAKLNVDSLKRLMEDSQLFTRAQGNSFKDRFYNAFVEAVEWTTPGLMAVVPFIERSRHPDLYPMHWWSENRARGVDDQFGSFDQFRAKLCTQTLAFEQRAKFEPYCKNAIMWSVFEDQKKTPDPVNGMSVVYSYFMEQSKQNPNDPVGVSNRICAQYDNARRNHVYWMTLDRKRDAEVVKEFAKGK